MPEQTIQVISADDGLVIYRRNKSKFLWCRTSLDGKQPRTSTKTENVDEAVEFAKKCNNDGVRVRLKKGDGKGTYVVKYL